VRWGGISIRRVPISGDWGMGKKRIKVVRSELELRGLFLICNVPTLGRKLLTPTAAATLRAATCGTTPPNKGGTTA